MAQVWRTMWPCVGRPASQQLDAPSGAPWVSAAKPAGHGHSAAHGVDRVGQAGEMVKRMCVKQASPLPSIATGLGLRENRNSLRVRQLNELLYSKSPLCPLGNPGTVWGGTKCTTVLIMLKIHQISPWFWGGQVPSDLQSPSDPEPVRISTSMGLRVWG